ncbi:MAG: hypothetical protein HY890_09160 [Deltaproteobacteria bacterium]|nr:hypothetical protein [Deltaproteobacteria bacterium]
MLKRVFSAVIVSAFLFSAAPVFAERIIFVEEKAVEEPGNYKGLLKVITGVVMFLGNKSGRNLPATEVQYGPVVLASADAEVVTEEGMQPLAVQSVKLYDKVTDTEEVVQIVNIFRYSF